MIAEPPVYNGGVHDKDTWVLPRVPITLVGGSGTVAGVIANEGNEGNEFPILFVAITVNVYAVPIVNPVIKPVVEEVVSVIPSGDDTIVY